MTGSWAYGRERRTVTSRSYVEKLAYSRSEIGVVIEQGVKDGVAENLGADLEQRRWGIKLNKKMKIFPLHIHTHTHTHQSVVSVWRPEHQGQAAMCEQYKLLVRETH